MKGNKNYRFVDNPKEQEFHDKFIEMFGRDGAAKKSLSAIVYGWSNDRQSIPNQWLDKEGEDVCINIIQWLGSPVGQGFLRECGFKDNK